MSSHIEPFQSVFMDDLINKWVSLARKYRQDSESQYVRLRSYLPMYQYRLSHKEKEEIREKLSSKLDETDQMDQVENMDNFLDGFCFKLDQTILPTLKNNRENKRLSQTNEENTSKKTFNNITTDKQEFIRSDSSSKMDCFPEAEDLTTSDSHDLDFYSMQFF